MKLNEELLEIDLIANKYADRHFIVECKGTDSSSCLIPIKESDEQDNTTILMQHSFEGTNYRIVGYELSTFQML